MTDPSAVPAEPDRVIDLSVEVPGTPEEVWRAIATGPGIGSWFVPHEVAEHEGGAVTMDFGMPEPERATVTAWQPPSRLVVTGDGPTPMAFEWLVEAADGGTCVVRLVNSGFGAGPDDEFEAMAEGWPIFLANLRLHLTHFAGRAARAQVPMASVAGPVDEAFVRLCSALGLSPDLAPGDRVATAGDAPPLAGSVVEVHRGGRSTWALLLLDAPTPGTAFVAAERSGDGAVLSTWVYTYDDDADDDAPWPAFLARAFQG